jgi:hypothetical protein
MAIDLRADELVLAISKRCSPSTGEQPAREGALSVVLWLPESSSRCIDRVGRIAANSWHGD